MESVMQRFVDLNQRNLAYLGITTSIESSEGKPCIKLTTSKYIGAIPIKSAHLQSSVFKLSKDLIDSIHEEGIVAYTS